MKLTGHGSTKNLQQSILLKYQDKISASTPLLDSKVTKVILSKKNKLSLIQVSEK